MKRVFQILLVSSLLFACNSTKKLVLGEEMTTYKAAGNDMANIYLRLYDSQNFVFEFTPFSFEEEATEKGINEVGTYTQDSDWYVLHFPKNSKLNLEDLFDQGTNGEEHYQIVNSRTLKLKKSLSVFYVWGILLEKQ